MDGSIRFLFVLMKYSFQFQESFLLFDPSGIAGQRTVAAYDAMTWNDDRNRIFSNRRTDRLSGHPLNPLVGRERFGDLPVAPGLTIGYLLKHQPYAFLKRRPFKSERGKKTGIPAGKVDIQPVSCLLRQRIFFLRKIQKTFRKMVLAGEEDARQCRSVASDDEFSQNRRIERDDAHLSDFLAALGAEHRFRIGDFFTAFRTEEGFKISACRLRGSAFHTEISVILRSAVRAEPFAMAFRRIVYDSRVSADRVFETAAVVVVFPRTDDAHDLSHIFDQFHILRIAGILWSVAAVEFEIHVVEETVVDIDMDEGLATKKTMQSIEVDVLTAMTGI